MDKKTKTKTSPKDKYTQRIDALTLNPEQKELVKMIWLDYFLILEKAAKTGWLGNNFSQIVVILFGLLIPVINGLSTQFDWVFAGSVTISILSVIIALISAVSKQIGLNNRWHHYRYHAEMIRNEGEDFFALSGAYKAFETHEEAFRDFCTNVNAYKRKEVTQFVKSQVKIETEVVREKAGQGK